MSDYESLWNETYNILIRGSYPANFDDPLIEFYTHKRTDRDRATGQTQAVMFLIHREISRLADKKSEREKQLEAALKRIGDGGHNGPRCHAIARNALQPKEGEQ
jgi:hypothetical protein